MNKKNGSSYPYLDYPKLETLSSDTKPSISFNNPQLFSEYWDPKPDFENVCLETTTFSNVSEKIQSALQLSYNMSSKNFFRNKGALYNESTRQKDNKNWIIHSYSKFKFYWSFLMSLMLTISVVELPIFVTFFNEDCNKSLIIFHCIFDIVFFIDVVVQFRTGIIDNGYMDEIIIEPKIVACHYLKTWFLIDLISSIPIDYFYYATNRNTNLNIITSAGRLLQMLRKLKILSLLRLLRIFRLTRYIKHLQNSLHFANRFHGTINVVLFSILLCHFNACLQFLVPMLQGFPHDSWVTTFKILDASWTDQYTWSLFKAISLIPFLGYNTQSPTNVVEAWLIIVSFLIGAISFTLIISQYTAAIYSSGSSNQHFNNKFKQLKEYMAYLKLPKNLRQKIIDYFHFYYQRKMFKMNDIFSDLSECLRKEIVIHCCQNIVSAVPMFANADPNFIFDIVIKLKQEVYQPGDKIISQGTIGSKMFFLLEGTVNIVSNDEKTISSLSNGSFFGENCLLIECTRTANVIAQTNCNLYTLDKTDFRSVLQNYPSTEGFIENIANVVLKKYIENPSKQKIFL